MTCDGDDGIVLLHITWTVWAVEVVERKVSDCLSEILKNEEMVV